MLHYSGSVSVRWSHCAACVHVCMRARLRLCVRQHLSETVLYSCLSCLHPNVCAVRRSSSSSSPQEWEKKHLHLSLSAQALGKKKSLSDVAACSHSQNPSSSFSPSLILSSLPPSSSKLLSDKHTHTLLSCDPLAAPRLVSLIVACVQSGHKPRDQPK